MKYKFLIFDLDDTLFDYSLSEVNALKNACMNQMIDFDEKKYIQYKEANKIAKQMMPDYLKKLSEFRKCRVKHFFFLIGEDNKDVEKFVFDYEENSKIGFLFDDVIDSLSRLDFVTKVVATNGCHSIRYNKFINSKIKDYFVGFFSSEQLGVEKPDKNFFEKILSFYNINRKEVLVIGDNVKTDIYGALNANLDCCLINRNKVEISLSVLNNKIYIIENLNELIHILKG